MHPKEGGGAELKGGGGSETERGRFLLPVSSVEAV